MAAIDQNIDASAIRSFKKHGRPRSTPSFAGTARELSLKPSHCLNALCLEPCSPRREATAAASYPWTGQSTLHQTSHSTLAVREFEPGEFEWRADIAHSGCVLSGNAILDLADGREVELRPGTSFYLPEGMHGHWMIKQRLRTVIVQTSRND